MRAARTAVGILTLAAIATAAAPRAEAEIIYAHRFSQGDLVRFDTDTATETVIGNTGITNAFGFSFSPSGTLYGLNQSGNLYTIDLNTAATTLIGDTGLGGSGPEALAFDLAGNLIGATSGSQLYSINATTGAASLIGNVTGITDVDGLSVAPTALTVAGVGAVAAGTIFSVDSGTLYAIDPNTLVATNLGSTNGSETLAFAPDGTLFVHDFSGSLYTRDLATGVESLVMSTSGSIASMAIQGSVSAVPEPSSLALLSIGACVAGALRRRRQRH